MSQTNQYARENDARFASEQDEDDFCPECGELKRYCDCVSQVSDIGNDPDDREPDNDELEEYRANRRGRS
jgi:hypothetical protein